MNNGKETSQVILENSILSLAESLASRFERTQAEFIRDMHLKIRIIGVNPDKREEIIEFIKENLELKDVEFPMPVAPFREALGKFWRSMREQRKLSRLEGGYKKSRIFAELRAEVAVQKVMDQAAIAINKDREADAILSGIDPALIAPYTLDDDFNSLNESLSLSPPPPSPTA